MTKRSGGGKLNKSEAVQVRFDPILKMAAELAAGKERRTLSSFTEMAVDQAVKQSFVTRDAKGEVNAWRVAQECWHTKPVHRLMNLAEQYPELLTIEERKLVQSARTALRFNDPLQPVSSAFAGIILEMVWPDVIGYAEERIEVTKLWMECRKAQAWLIEESGCRIAGLLRQFAKDELSPADLAVHLSKDDRYKEQILIILGEV